MSLLRSLHIGLCCLALVPASALACGPYRLAFSEYGALYHRDPDGQYRGIDRDVVEELARRTGCRLETALESRARMWALMDSGGLDITVSALMTPERERQFEMLPYLQSRRVVLLQYRAVPAAPEAFLADPTRRLLTVRSSREGPQMEALLVQLRQQGRIVEAPDQPTAIRAFKAGRADALLIGTTTLALLRQQDPDFKAYESAVWAPLERTVGALAMSRERVSEDHRARIRAGLLSMRRDGSLDAIVRRHVGDKLAQAIHLPEGEAER